MIGKNQKNIKKILICFLVAILLEIFLFNFRTWQSMFYQEKVIGAEQMRLDGFAVDTNGGVYETEGIGVIYLFGLDKLLGDAVVHNVYLDWEMPDAKDTPVAISGICTISPLIRDEGHDRYTQFADHIFRQEIEASHYLWIQGSGKVRTVVLQTECSEAGSILIRQIVVNAHKPLEMSFGRLFVLSVLALCILAIRDASWKAERKEKKAGTEFATVVLVGAAIILPAAILIEANAYIKIDRHFLPYQLLAEALADGQPYLKIEPSDVLKAMDNPYDYTARVDLGLEDNIDYLWDTAYYNGHYYTYFGIVPCLVIYLPAWLLTGKHISEPAVVLSCAIAFYFGVWALVRSWCRRYHYAIPYVLQMVATVTIFLGSNIMGCLGNPDAHDVPRLCGMVFLAWGMHFWIASLNTGTTEEAKQPLLWQMSIGSFFMALAVGCRPNLALYSFLAIVIFWNYRKKKNGEDIATVRKRYLALILPYIPIALGLMYYNYIRFGSITDFGFAYNLTVQDCSRTVISLDKVVLGIYDYLLKLPQMEYCFPFLVSGSFAELNNLGHATVYITYCFGGLLVCNLVTWCIPALCGSNRGEAKGLWQGRILAVIVLIQLLITALTGGISYNYMADFAFPLILVGWEGAWIWWERLQDGEGQRIFRGFLLLGLVWSFCFHICFYFLGTLDQGNTELYYRFFYAFHFF